MTLQGDLLVIAIEGSGADGDAPDFDAWRAEIGAIAEILSAIDRQLHSREILRWRLEDLHHSAPTICLRPEWAESAAPAEPAAAVVSVMMNALRDVKGGRDPEVLGSDALDAFRKALRPFGTLLRKAVILYGTVEQQLDLDVANALAAIKFRDEVSKEDWEGSLDEINVHSANPTFRLYPAVSKRWITCEIKPSYIEQAQKYLLKKVSVYGEAIYRPKEHFPYRVRVETITPLTDPDDEPLEALTGSMSEEQTMRVREKLNELRDGWTK